MENLSDIAVETAARCMAEYKRSREQGNAPTPEEAAAISGTAVAQAIEDALAPNSVGDIQLGAIDGAGMVQVALTVLLPSSAVVGRAVEMLTNGEL